MSPGTERCVLKIKEGKFVIVRMFKDGPKLCAVEIQNGENNAPPVHILTRERNQKKQMALQFQHCGASYSPKVDGKKLMLQSGQIPDNDSHWFEKRDEGGAEHWGLQSVVDPTQFVSIRLVQKKQHILILSEAPQDCVLVTITKRE